MESTKDQAQLSDAEFGKDTVVVYVSTQGVPPVQIFTGWLGRLVHHDALPDTPLAKTMAAAGMLMLDDAIEFQSIIQPNQQGGITRTCQGSPIEFLPNPMQVWVKPMGLVAVGDLAPDLQRTFRGAVQHVQQMRTGLTAEVPMIHTPDGAGPGGRPKLVRV